ncbi:MAG TPA: endopeptidase La [Thermoanaerobaculia bacterium]|nr:endopeptidase La [Thermoanaerobaculia bacterium]
MSDTFQTEPEDRPEIPDVLPVLPLKDTVLFPFIIVPLSITSDASAQAVDHALANNRVVLLASQRDPGVDQPGAQDLYEVGTAALIMRMLKLPDGRIRVLVQGLSRARIRHVGQTTPFLKARVETLEESQAEDSLEGQALLRTVREHLERAVHLGKTISSEVMVIATNLEDAGRLADLAASNLELKVHDAQQILEICDPIARLLRVSELLHREVQLLTMQHEISSQARGEIDRSQREYFLRQQLKAIQEELGETDDLSEELAAYRDAADEKQLSEEAREELERQLRRLERSHPDSAENSVIRSYLDWLVGLPWTHASEDHLDLEHAEAVLDEDHYDLEKVKERILEYLAVRKLKPDAKGPILCFVGPPGVGKTSLGRSIARALGRQFVRLSLGGVRDEAEVRGHRRTYVGALPGRIIQGIHQAGTANPVFMLDEIDKVGADYRGDPSSALLEVLDPEQNHAFRDHYLGVSYDLSTVMFITTANLLEPIQPAFLDRMEVIRLSGYTADEKLEIANGHLIPKQIRENGVECHQLRFTRGGLRKVLTDYTKEAGVRSLEREIASICRKVAVRVARGDRPGGPIDAARVERMLGPAKHFTEDLLDRDRVGVATGLAWTASGGDILLVEAALLPGKGNLLLTGQLGDVMRESAQAALSYARAYASDHGADRTTFAECDVHIHVPAGSIPKDGPSAGITIATAIISQLTGRAVDRSLAMTGELTLRGEVMPIGGLREKILAALAAGVRTVVIPEANRRDLSEVPAATRRRVDLKLVEHVEQVLELALLDAAAPEIAAGVSP